MPKCKSCGRDIRFVEMPTGRKMPIEVTPKNVVAKVGGQWKTITGYESHFVNCPDADNHRRPKTTNQEIGPLTKREGGA